MLITGTLSLSHILLKKSKRKTSPDLRYGDTEIISSEKKLGSHIAKSVDLGSHEELGTFWQLIHHPTFRQWCGWEEEMYFLVFLYLFCSVMSFPVSIVSHWCFLFLLCNPCYFTVIQYYIWSINPNFVIVGFTSTYFWVRGEEAFMIIKRYININLKFLLI